MRQIDYDEPVTIVWNEKPNAETARQKVTAHLRLAEAVRHVMPNWSARPHARLCIIRREAKRKPFTTYQAVRSIYDRPDFPKG